ncbi:MAG TPA: class I tRNA ligase family protein, partial [Acidimicrobiia bacterium]|nr:class I tRNA ligase family protein [Acidimicrobiia bacterium]
FMGPLERDKPWSTTAIEGVYRFLQRAWRACVEEDDEGGGPAKLLIDDSEPAPEDLKILHKTIKKVTEDIERFAFNTAVPALMTLVNTLVDYVRQGARRETFDYAVEKLLLLLSPMAPHIAHELWERTGHTTMLATEAWPEYDPELAKLEVVTMVIQVNGKVRDRAEVDASISADDAERLALESPRIKEWIGDGEVKKVISRPPRLVNIVVG